MGRATDTEEPQPPQDQYHHSYDQTQETPTETYYAAGEDQPEVTSFHYDPSENTPPPPQRAPPPPPAQPVQFPPPSPPPQPQVFPPPQQGQPQAYPPQYGQQPGQPQAFPPQQGKPQAFPPQQYGQPQAFPQQQYEQPQQQYGQPQAFPQQQYEQPQQQYGQPQAFPQQQYEQPQQQYGQPQGYQPQKPNMGYDPNKPGTPIGFPLPQHVATNGWSSDLFDCMNDPENAIITACFPCVTYGQIAEMVDNGQSSCESNGMIYGCFALFGFPCIISCGVRTKLRSRYGLAESPAPDWITHCLCMWCALCQEYRELNFQGLDPALGWQGNVMKQQQIQMQQQATMAPPVNQTMM